MGWGRKHYKHQPPSKIHTDLVLRQPIGRSKSVLSYIWGYYKRAVSSAKYSWILGGTGRKAP